MRAIIFLVLCCLVSSVYAAEQHESQSASPLPDMNGGSPDQEPQVTITKQTGQTVEEYRSGGRLYMIKITPKHGKPYYLVDDRGDGRFSRQDNLDSGVRPPMWIIHRF